MNIIQQIEKAQLEKLSKDKSIPNFRTGDSLRVLVKVIEGERQRHQPFEGVVIGRKNKGLKSTFRVRKISYGEGVERVFSLYSPNIKIEVVRHGDVRRSKLYYLRDRRGKSARIAERAYRGNDNKAIKEENLLEATQNNAAAESLISEVVENPITEEVSTLESTEQSTNIE